MSKKLKPLLLACVCVALCLALVIAGTYALFSDSATIKNHLQAGQLQVKLVREKLTIKELDTATGLLKDRTETAEMDFTGATSANVFGLASKTLVAPGCSYTADLRIENGGNVAFTYWVEIKLNDAANALSDQIRITVTPEEGAIQTKLLSEGLTLGSASSGVANILIGSTSKFSVKIEFADLANNNSAMNQEVQFDLIIHATQITTAA